MYNKYQYHKYNNKKVLHKVRKQWVTISLLLFMMIGSGAIASHTNASANSINHQEVSNTQTKINKSRSIINKATSLHQNLINNANINTVRLGSIHSKRLNIIKNRFKRSNNNHALKRSGYVNATKYHGNFVFNKYAPNDKRAVISKHLNLKHLNWAMGRFGQSRLVLFTHKGYGWNKLSKRSAHKYRNILNRIYHNYKNSNHIHVHSYKKSKHMNTRKSHNFNRHNSQSKRYKHWKKHGFKRMHKPNNHVNKSKQNNVVNVHTNNPKVSYSDFLHYGHRITTTLSNFYNMAKSDSNGAFNDYIINDTSHLHIPNSHLDNDSNLIDNDGLQVPEDWLAGNMYGKDVNSITKTKKSNIPYGVIHYSDGSNIEFLLWPNKSNSDSYIIDKHQYDQSDNNPSTTPLSPSDKDLSYHPSNRYNYCFSSVNNDLEPSGIAKIIQQTKYQVLKDINNLRQSHNLTPLTENTNLDSLANIISKDSNNSNYDKVDTWGNYLGDDIEPAVDGIELAKYMVNDNKNDGNMLNDSITKIGINVNYNQNESESTTEQGVHSYRPAHPFDITIVYK